MRGWLIAITIVAIALTGCGVSAKSDSGVDPGLGSQDATADIALSACQTTRQYGISDVAGTYTVTNNSDGTSDYFIDLNVERDGVIIGSGFVSVNHVGAGQQAEGKILALLDGDPPAGPCQFVLTTVQRIAS